MSQPSQQLGSSPRQLPGEVGLWLFILSDLLLFALFFVLFSHDLATDPESFQEVQGTLSRSIGLFNTLLLLTGSWAVAMGTRVERNPARSAGYLSAAALSGVLFLILKAVEYGHLFSAGYSLTDSSFFTWYFFLSGYHALHVVAGIVILQVVVSQYRRRKAVTEELVEAAGCYWHLVDLLWIGIFSIVYLV